VSVHPRPIHASLGQSESISRTVHIGPSPHRSVQPFFQDSQQRVPKRYNGPPLFPSKFPLRIGKPGPSEYMVPEAHTDATPSVTIGRICVRSTAMRPNEWSGTDGPTPYEPAKRCVVDCGRRFPSPTVPRGKGGKLSSALKSTDSKSAQNPCGINLAGIVTSSQSNLT